MSDLIFILAPQKQKKVFVSLKEYTQNKVLIEQKRQTQQKGKKYPKLFFFCFKLSK